MQNTKRATRAFIVLTCVLLVAAGQTAGATSAEIEVMVLGTYHMANPGRDVVNSKIDDVTTPTRQQELQDVSNRLAKFKPTKIAIEVTPVGENYFDPGYQKFKPENLLSNRNEITQIAYRLAHQVGHRDVYAIDEKSSNIDYFPFGKVQAYAKSAGREAELARIVGIAQSFSKQLEARQASNTAAQLLAFMNEPASIRGAQHLYTGLLSFGERGIEERWPGAELNAAWYLRNAKIFAKLTRVAAPGDRIVVLFGAGHAYQLREFVSSTKGFRLVEPNAYLLP